MKEAVKLLGIFTGRKCIIAAALFMFVLLLGVNQVLAADPMDTWKLTYCGSNVEDRKMTSAAYGGGTVTAVGEMDKILYSTNGGKNWTAREYSGSRYLQDIGYGANKFAAVGRYDTTAVSNDGVSWSMSYGEPGTTNYDYSYGGITTYTYGTADYNFTDIVYGNGKFVAVGFVDLRYKYDNYLGRGVIKTSTDGVNWQYQVYSKDKNVHSFYDLTFVNGKFVAALRESLSKIIATSSNGVDWEFHSLRPTGYSSDISQIVYGNGVYMAVFFNGSVMTSPDCENWTEVGVISSSGYFRPSDLIFTKGIFVVTGNKTFYSVDGKQWTEAATISGPGYSLRALAPVNDIVLGLGDYLSVYQSEPLEPPAAPLMLSADAGANSVNVFWRDIPDSETGYRVFRSSTIPDNYHHIVTLEANSFTFTDSGLELGKTYKYKVQAFNSYGSSAYSDAATATTKITIPKNIRLLPPAAAENLTATGTSFSQIRLKWDDKSVNETGFRVERKSGTGVYKMIGLTAANSEEYVDNGLQPGTEYTYRVRAYSTNGSSAYSGEAKAATWPKINISIPTLTVAIPVNVIDLTRPVIPQAVPEPDEPENTPEPSAKGNKDTIVVKLSIDNPQYTVNGQTKTMDTSPMVYEDRTLLPIRFVAEAIGAEVGWDGGEQKVTVSHDGRVIELWLGKNQARVGGVVTSIDPANPAVTPLLVPPGRTVLPLRFVTEQLGCSVDWDGNTKTVTVTYTPE